ncbi:hypothetical protein FIBSPDRAFT_1008531 [Athelia psychrophila]|uniref:Uncharacterized protein n=1 Tax=Athelia psychrophila TaxID=1759441 RepID=A0A167V6W7_9AGAM|nr:hypothetical protein FIBSPDRAFT_1008531 [Fibularhizoctonia sp. CBS 109695]
MMASSPSPRRTQLPWHPLRRCCGRRQLRRGRCASHHYCAPRSTGSAPTHERRATRRAAAPRALGPEKWTRSRLAEKFNCTSHFRRDQSCHAAKPTEEGEQGVRRENRGGEGAMGGKKLVREIAAKQKTFW